MIRTPVRHGYEIEHGLIVDVDNKPVIKIEDFRVRDHIIVALNSYKWSAEDREIDSSWRPENPDNIAY